jgi:hypothetical protein
MRLKVTMIVLSLGMPIAVPYIFVLGESIGDPTGASIAIAYVIAWIFIGVNTARRYAP